MLMKRRISHRDFFVFPVIISLVFLPIFSAQIVRADTTSDINQQIQSIQQQIDQYQQQIDAVHSQAVTYQGQIAVLTAQINQLTLQIKSLQLSISQTNTQIKDTQNKISDAEVAISQDQIVLAQYLRVVYQNDQETLTGILFKNNTLSGFFNDVNSISTTQDQLKTTLDGIKANDVSLNATEQELEDKQNDLQKQQGAMQVNERTIAADKAAQNALLKNAQGQESSLQQKKAALQQEIYYLQQNGVSVDDAIKYGNLMAIAAGIRPAFLLAELDQESGIGQNVGKCNRVGDPPSKSYKVVMKPSRDIQPFLQITAQLGLDPDTTPISCAGAAGYGGALGPAQFLPSTWLGYVDQVTSLTGHSPANPWNIQDAFAAAATKLARAGAGSKDRVGEVAASKIYYCGNPASTRKDCINYANNVQALEAQIAQNL